MKATITCKKAVDLISKKEEGKLSAAQRVQLWRHLSDCSLCRTFSEQNKLMIKAWRQQLQHAPTHLSMTEKEMMIQAIVNREQEK